MVQCNIDKRGQFVRLVAASLMLVVSLCIGLFWALDLISGWWLVAALLGAGISAFTFFEASKRWCALRAMGLRTPI